MCVRLGIPDPPTPTGNEVEELVRLLFPLCVRVFADAVSCGESTSHTLEVPSNKKIGFAFEPCNMPFLSHVQGRTNCTLICFWRCCSIGVCVRAKIVITTHISDHFRCQRFPARPPTPTPLKGCPG